ncbi:hypothetical protein MPLB_1510044 [Mesorhizobium sp. ORS 3324]|nr:hypothetical protein MPLB_1510044 [Mesorhizobium sp. ORS 3324]
MVENYWQNIGSLRRLECGGYSLSVRFCKYRDSEGAVCRGQERSPGCNKEAMANSGILRFVTRRACRDDQDPPPARLVVASGLLQPETVVRLTFASRRRALQGRLAPSPIAHIEGNGSAISR